MGKKVIKTILGHRDDVIETLESKFLTEQQVKSIHDWIKKMKKLKSYSDRRKKRKAKHALHLHYKIIGCGRHRIVYDLKNGYVLKVAISKRGHRNNKKEFKLYTKCHRKLLKYLCSAREVGFGWIVMKRVKPLHASSNRYERLISFTEKKFRSRGVHPCDLKYSNLSYNKSTKRIIVIDYGDYKIKS